MKELNLDDKSHFNTWWEQTAAATTCSKANLRKHRAQREAMSKKSVSEEKNSMPSESKNMK